LILVWKKYPEGKNQDGSPVDLEKFQKRIAQREALFLEVSKFVTKISKLSPTSLCLF